MYIAVARSRGCRRALNGTIQNDILKEYIARGTYIFPPAPRCGSSPTSSPSARTRSPAEQRSASPLPHPRGGVDGGAGGRLHPRQRDRLRAGAIDAGMSSTLSRRAWPSLQRPQQLLEEVAKSGCAAAVGGSCGPVRGEGSPLLDAPFTRRPRVVPHRAAARQQRRPGDDQALAAVLGGNQSLHTNSRDEALSFPRRLGAHRPTNES